MSEKKFRPFHESLVEWLRSQRRDTAVVDEFTVFEVSAVCRLAACTIIPKQHRRAVRSGLEELTAPFSWTSAESAIQEALTSLDEQDAADREDAKALADVTEDLV